MKALGRLAAVGVTLLALLQCARPGIPTQPATAEVQVPPKIRSILETHCYACHSDERRLSWFDESVPGYWLVRHDILTGRRHLNFSTLGARPATAQKAALYEAVTMVQLGAMPLAQFIALHPNARMSPEDLDTLKSYLSPWSNQPSSPASPEGPPSATPGPPIDLASVQPEPGGISFDPSFSGWKVLSATDRGDNNSLRLILGNDIAVQAARSGNVKPWPTGTRFAKIAWQQEPGPDGYIHPGGFIQVELMDKDSVRYKSTDGWGWARWRGLDLKPYGSDAGYVSECTGCHLPVRGDDDVYTLPISGATVAGSEVLNLHAAALPVGLPYQPLDWNAITVYVDPSEHTMSILFGNPQAVAAVHPRARLLTAPSYPPGAVLALVTWVQRDDPHWFGARIPDAPQSVEIVQIGSPPQSAMYRSFAGLTESQDHVTDAGNRRLHLILGLTPAALP